MENTLRRILAAGCLALCVPAAQMWGAETADSTAVSEADAEGVYALGLRAVPDSLPAYAPITAPALDTSNILSYDWLPHAKPTPVSPYALPYSLTGKSYNWHRLWINSAVLSSAFVGTLLVLECLPEDATTWNRAALQKYSPFYRWYRHIFIKGPEWDHDNFVFNYVLHPYAGAAYYMGARSQGFNAYQSLLYATIVSTVGWEFGIEACMERPSYQDLFVTPLCGAVIGEGFYLTKRYLVNNNYRLLGSPILGNVVAFLVDPLNEAVGWFAGDPARRIARAKATDTRAHLALTPRSLSLSVTF